MKNRFTKLNQSGFDHILVAVFVAVFVVIGGVFFVLTHASPWSGALKIDMANTNLCMENMDNSNVAYTTVDINTCNSSSQAQHWTIQDISGSTSEFQIVASASGACVDDTGNGIGTNASNRVHLQTWPCSSTDHAQVWHWGGTGNHQLISVGSGGCINDPSNTTTPGQYLVVFSCAASAKGNGANAEWLEGSNSAGGATKPVVPTNPSPSAPGSSGGTQLSVGPKGSNYCMDASAVKSGGNVILNECSSSKASQKWKVVSAGNFTYTYGSNHTKGSLPVISIQNATSGTSQCVDDFGTSHLEGAAQNPVKLYGCNTKDDAQLFYWTGDGHQLRNVGALADGGYSLCLDDSQGVRKNDTTVDFYTCKASAATNQDWYE